MKLTARKILAIVGTSIAMHTFMLVTPVHAVAQAPQNESAVPPAEAEAAAAEKAAHDQLKGVIRVANAWINRPELQRSYVGLEVMDIPSGRVIFSHNGRRRFASASIAKVITTACAYDTFGSAYTFRTSLVGYGEIHGSRLTGPLVIMPSQDPSFTSDDLRDLLASLQSKVKSVSGTLIVASQPGGGDRFPTEWLIQDWGQDWMPPSSDLVIDRNVVASRDPGRGYPVNVATYDKQPDALFKTLLQGSSWGSAWVIFNKGSNTVTLNRPDQSVTGGFVVGNPTEFNAAVARVMLKNVGVKLENRDMPLPSDQIPFGDHVSKPLSEILRFTLKESDNLYAQQLLRLLGTQPALNRQLESASLEERGLARVNVWLNSIGLPAGDAVLWDGCGLSRKNAIAPHALNVVLRHMAGASGNGPYIDLLIHEGEGPTKTFRYKTGAMDSVRSISGIVRTATGQPFAVTAIINDHNPSVRELRPTLHALTSELQALGSVKLRPAVEPPRLRARAARSARAPHAAHVKPPRRASSSRSRRSRHR